MTARAYISNISPLWPVDRQEAALAAGVPGWPVPIYRDILPAKERQAHAPDSLPERAALIRAGRSRRGVLTLYVASLAVLARSVDDLAGIAAELQERGAALVALDIAADASGMPADLAAAFKKSRLRAAQAKARAIGSRNAAIKLSKKEAALRLKPFWGLKEYKTADLLAREGITRNTANKHIGMTREQAIKQHEALLKRRVKREQT
jgi:hypothetical protein